MGGGFHLFIGQPSASSDPAAAGGLLLVQVQGCAKPLEAEVTATAKNTAGRSVPLQVTRLKANDSLVLKGDEVKTGNWVITVTGSWKGHQTTSTVELRDGARYKSGQSGGV
jgi:hypothetical protein